MVRQYMVEHIGDEIALVEYERCTMASPDIMLGTLLDTTNIRFGQGDALQPCFDEEVLRQRNLRRVGNATFIRDRRTLGSAD
jgi:hypothetical protein